MLSHNHKLKTPVLHNLNELAQQSKKYPFMEALFTKFPDQFSYRHEGYIYTFKSNIIVKTTTRGQLVREIKIEPVEQSYISNYEDKGIVVTTSKNSELHIYVISSSSKFNYKKSPIFGAIGTPSIIGDNIFIHTGKSIYMFNLVINEWRTIEDEKPDVFYINGRPENKSYIIDSFDKGQHYNMRLK